jgi:4-hydroxy-tetrahydrodipicolinate synthase
VSDAELCELCARAARQLHGRVGVVAGAGTSSTAGTVAKVALLAALPVDALLLVTPAYNRPAQEGLFQHFSAAARAAGGRPVILYNVPARTAVDMLPATVARLSRVPGIVAVKEAVPDPQRVRELLAQAQAGFVVLSGDDATARASIQAGARGVISVTANVAPRQMSDMVAAALAGDQARAQALDAPLAGLHRDLFLEANPIPVKWLLQQMGRIGSGVRLPLTPLAEEFQGSLRQAAQAAQVLP